jgi:septation ring formation regulator
MNQMQVKIAKYKLPSISEQYDADMKKANNYLSRLTSLINAVPLNVQLLNSTLKEAIDFIYRLYNNVNNVVATVMMVENTIVFGNRYRSYSYKGWFGRCVGVDYERHLIYKEGRHSCRGWRRW